MLVLGLCALVGGGIKVYTAYRMNDLAQTLQKAKEKRAQQQNETVTEAVDSPSPAKAEASPVENKDPKALAQPAGTNKVRKNSQPSACSAVYQKYVENRKIREAMLEALDDMMELADKDMDNDPCVQQLTDVIDPEQFIALTKKCNMEANADKESTRACLVMMAIGWGAFAELEYRNVDPSDIPPHALHSKINFRLAEFSKFKKEADQGEKEYLFKLMDHMHKIRPDIDYGTMRDDLIAEFHSRDPQTWKDDYKRILDELVTQDVSRAVSTFYEGNGRKMDRAFFEYVDGLVKQYPDNPVVHIYKGFAHAGLGEWDQAAKEQAEAERLAPNKNKELMNDLRKAIQAKEASMSTTSWWSISIDLPDASATN